MKMCAPPPFRFFSYDLRKKHQLTKATCFCLNPYSHTACQSPTIMGAGAALVSHDLRPPRVLLRAAVNHNVRGLGVLQWHSVQTQLCSYHTTGSQD